MVDFNKEQVCPFEPREKKKLAIDTFETTSPLYTLNLAWLSGRRSIVEQASLAPCQVFSDAILLA